MLVFPWVIARASRSAQPATLPIGPPAGGSTSAFAAAPMKRPKSNLPAGQEPTVVVIEDDPATALLYRDLLGDAGYCVTMCTSGLGAVAAVHRARPRVIVLDVGLPYHSGIAVLRDLKGDSVTADVPVIVASALADLLPPDARALTAAVLVKPFDADALIAAVRRAATGAASDGAGASLA